MDKTLSQNLNGLLEFLQKGMTTAYEAGKTEVPLFIQEYLSYKMYLAVADTLFFILLIVSLLLVGKKCVSKASTIKLDEWGHITGLAGLLYTSGICCILISALLIFPVYDGVRMYIKIKVAPRVVLMEAAKELVK